MDDVKELREATEHWKNSENNHKETREQLVTLLRDMIDSNKYNLTQLSLITGINRTTLYYMIWGKNGKRQQVA